MFYLGQSVSYKRWANSKPIPAIITGFAERDNPLLTFFSDTTGALEKHATGGWLTDILPLRRKDKKSITGYSVYTGSLYKEGFIAQVKLKLPEDAVLEKELIKAKKILEDKE